MRHKLSREEREIEKNIDNYVPISKTEKKRIDTLLKKAAKDRTITLRINSADLARLREMAVREGMPYQTLISSILHKYADNRLCDMEEARKVLRRA